MEPAPHIFREYDIRGIVGKDLDAEVTRWVGRSFASLAQEAVSSETPAIVVGHDNRPSSPELAEAMAEGLREGGAEVTMVGTVPTGVLYWAEVHLGADAGIQVTGSHNPPEWNGIKMSLQGRALYGDDIQELRERIVSGTLPTDGGGRRTEREILDDYVEDIAGRIRLERPVRAAVDCGNGTASVVAVRLLEAIGAEVSPLFCESDGTFPNHHPDPSVDENLEDLRARVREGRSEVGIAFDGDGDRLGVLDEEGNVVRGDLLLLLFGLDLLDRHGPGQKLIFDVKCSQVLPEVFAREGGEPIMWKTGHSLIKEKMREEGAPLAGELSGHICFADDYIGVDDALYDACRLLELLARKDRYLSEIVAEYPQYVSTPEIRVEVGEERKWEVVREARDHFSRDHEVIDVDGVRVLFDEGWALLRASNTQPVVVTRYEAKDEEGLERIQDDVEGWLRDRGVKV